MTDTGMLAKILELGYYFMRITKAFLPEQERVQCARIFVIVFSSLRFSHLSQHVSFRASKHHSDSNSFEDGLSVGTRRSYAPTSLNKQMRCQGMG